jgi:hypothetical protein
LSRDVAKDDAPGNDRVDERAAAFCGLPLTLLLAAFTLYLLVSWAPHYLTWPWNRDLDAYAMMARQWDAGLQPYRDVGAFNFPGQIYLTWVMGKLAGWARPEAVLAADVGFILLLGGVLLVWSGRIFGRIAPGLAAFVAVLAFYLNQDYWQTAQRDWHGPLFLVIGLLLLQCRLGRLGVILSALSTAVAMAFRPHVVLLFPAILTALILSTDRTEPGEGRKGILGRTVAWSLAFIVGIFLVFAPLLLHGVLLDLVVGIRNYASKANHPITLAGVARGIFVELRLDWRIVIIVLGNLLLAGKASPRARRAFLAWLVAVICVLFYAPVHPIAHRYLHQPGYIIFAIHIGLFVGLALEALVRVPLAQVLAIALAIGLAVPGEPIFCSLQQVPEAIATLRRGEIAASAPLGYRRSRYEWADYRGVLNYLRTQTPADVQVANLLQDPPALAGPAGRISVFHKESGIANVLFAHPDNEPQLADDLRKAENSVVVWVPGEPSLSKAMPPLDLLKSVVRELYEPETRFGVIEVWKRKARQPETPVAK